MQQDKVTHGATPLSAVVDEEADEGLSKRETRVSGRRMGRSAALAAVRAEKGRRERKRVVAKASRRRVRDVVQTITSPHGTSRILVRSHEVPRLTAEERAAHYATQNGTMLKLTPAQRRRLRKKANRSGERTSA